MSSYMLNGFGNGTETGLPSDVPVGYQLPDNQGRWQVDGMWNGASARQSTFGTQGGQNQDTMVANIVAGATEAYLERNAFYIGFKRLATDRATEIDALKATIGLKDQELESRAKQVDALTAQCGTLEGTIDRFARDYHTLKNASGDSDRGQTTFIMDLLPMPMPWKRAENPEVTIWIKGEYIRALTDTPKGESSGDSATTKPKAKVGRPSRKDNVVSRKNMYLQGRDGNQISAEKLTKLSIKARSAWESLLAKGMAPTTFSKMSYNAWDFYARVVLTDPELDFLLLCDDGQWKLKEWSTQNYSCWAGNRGLRPKNTGQKTGKNKDILDDPALIRMPAETSNETDDSVEPADPTSGSVDSGFKETTPELAADDAGDSEVGDDLYENSSSSTQLLRGLNSTSVTSVIANPFAPTAPSSASTNHTGPSAVTSKTSGHTVAAGDVCPPAGQPSTTNLAEPSLLPPRETTADPIPDIPATVTTASKDSASATQTHAAADNTLRVGDVSTTETVDSTGTTPHGADGPSRPVGTTPTSRSDPAAMTTSREGALPPRPRIKLTLKPQAKSTVMQKSPDHDLGPIAPTVPSKSTQRPTAAGLSDGQNTVPDHHNPAPTNAPPPNLRLDRANANTGKKRKAEGKTAPVGPKKQKTTNALAQPTSAISIRNICMRQWNEQQPGGQGFAADFDTYFKALSDEDKEPLKTEMRIAQGIARKAKTAAKKPMGNEVPPLVPVPPVD